MASFSGMGIKPQYRYAGLSDAKLMFEIVVQNMQRFNQAGFGDCLGNLCQWQVGGGQGNPQITGGQQHYYPRCIAAFSEILGVTAESDTGIVDH